MAQQIHRDHVLGNFRPSLRERSKPRLSAQQRREGNSEKHLMLIRLLPCAVTGKRPPCDPHHLLAGPAKSERAFGRRSTDRYAVPLSRAKHDELHKLGTRREAGWFRDHGISDVYELANALWLATGDLERMRKVLAAHMGR